MPRSDVTMPVRHEKHLRAATRAAGVALWSWNVDTDAITMDEPAYDKLGGHTSVHQLASKAFQLCGSDD